MATDTGKVLHIQRTNHTLRHGLNRGDRIRLVTTGSTTRTGRFDTLYINIHNGLGLVLIEDNTGNEVSISGNAIQTLERLNDIPDVGSRINIRRHTHSAEVLAVADDVVTVEFDNGTIKQVPADDTYPA